MAGLRIRAQGTLQTSSAGGRLPVLPPRPHWHDQAACEKAWSHGYVEFVPDGSEEKAAKDLAKTYCNRCPVRPDCLANALVTKSHGIWAGTTKAQRDKLARTRNRVKCPVCLCETLISVDEHDLCMACANSWRTERRTASTERPVNEHGDQ